MEGSPRPEERQRAGRKPKEVVHDVEGCSVCGIHASSSFRTDPFSKQRMCNACHCRVYRLKRRAAEEAAGAGGSRRRASTQQQALQPASSEQTLPVHERGAGGLGGSSDGDTATGRWPLALPDPAAGAAAAAAALQSAEAVAAVVAAAAVEQQHVQQHVQQQRSSGSTAGAPSGQSSHEINALLAMHQQQQHMLADLAALQRRALAGADSPRLLLACARRSRLATPGGPEQRAVLGLLPSVRLRLPGDAPGLLHTVACLLEAVVPCAAAEGEQGADSIDGMRLGTPRAGRCMLGGAASGDAAAAAGGWRGELALRTTVFAAAGAVACWHEAPPSADACLTFCPASKAPTWGPGTGAFTLHFPSAYDSQVDLLAASHRYLALMGPAALVQPVLSLEDPGPGLDAQPAQQMQQALAAQQQQLAAQLAAAEQEAQQAQLAAAAQQAQLLQQAEVVDDPSQHSLLGLLAPGGGGLPLQLSFGPVPSGPLGSSDDGHPGLAFFDF